MNIVVHIPTISGFNEFPPSSYTHNSSWFVIPSPSNMTTMTRRFRHKMGTGAYVSQDNFRILTLLFWQMKSDSLQTTLHDIAKRYEVLANGRICPCDLVLVHNVPQNMLVINVFFNSCVIFYCFVV